ncbi:hypothetical protein [Butyricicoccus sp.]
MQNIKIQPETIPKIECKLLCGAFLQAIEEFYKDPVHLQEFEEWKKARES